MGSPNLAAANIPFWPTSNSPEDWPLTSNKKHKLTRFRFDRPASDPDNVASLERIIEFITNNGAKFHTAAAPALRHISEKDLRDRVHLKFRDLQKVLRAAGRLPKRGEAFAKLQGEEGGKAEGGEERLPVLTKSQRQSRAKGVSEVEMDRSLRCLTLHAETGCTVEEARKIT
jgi:hypothetical protein